jgi:hypothetical protein
MPRKSAAATPADAELILKLYDLRRETEMRKARNYIMGEFWPQTFEDFQKVGMAFGTPQNAYFRQFSSYWEMACTLVLTGALNEQLFFMNNGEMFMFFAKMKPLLKQVREAMGNPEYLANMERVIEATPEGRERLQRTQANLARFAEMRKQQAQSHGA